MVKSKEIYKYFNINPRYKESYLVELYYIRQLFEYGDLEYKFYPESHKKFYIVPMDSIRQFGMSV